ncbi:MAG TPA: hypothetical protein VIK86_05580 [Candidatus Paceibacterota bacterium]
MANKKPKIETIVKDITVSKEAVISENGLVKIIATENSSYLKNGKEYEVSINLAKTLVKKGSVIYK